MKIVAAEAAAVAEVVDHGRDRVVASLLHQGPATAAVLAGRLALSTTAVRRHLDTLVADGLVEALERPPYGPAPRRGRGRPARVFTLTAAGRSTFPDDYDELAVSVLGFLAEHSGPDAVAGFARARAAQLSAALLQRLGPRWQTEPLEAQLRAMAAALTDLGFAASVDPAPTGAQLCQHHCPVSHVAERFPQLCEAETVAFAELLGHHVQRLATLAQGAGVCTTVIPDPVAAPGAAEHAARQQHLPPVDERTSA